MGTPRKSRSATEWEVLASRWVKHLGEFQTARTARDAVQQGNHLLLLKAAAPHGTWRDRVNMLGMEARIAQRLMAVARRFADAPSALLDAVGSVSKLVQLLPLDDEDVATLAQGGALGGLTLDLIVSMTVQELRAAVRAARAAQEGMQCGRAASTPAPQHDPSPAKAVRLSVEEERILRLFRQCDGPAREALFSVAGLLARP